MEIRAIYDYLNELSRCEWRDNAIVNGIKYNGITIEQGTETYQRILDTLQSEAEEGILSLASSGQDKVLRAIYRKAKDAYEQDCDIITPLAVEALKQEFPIPRSEAVKAEIELGEFVIEMHRLQLYYLGRLLSFLNSLLEDNTTVEVEATQPELEKRPTPTDNKNYPDVISGTDGLKHYLGCSHNKAFDIIKSKILPSDTQYMTGRVWKFNRKRLDEFLSKHPEALGKVRKGGVIN